MSRESSGRASESRGGFLCKGDDKGLCKGSFSLRTTISAYYKGSNKRDYEERVVEGVWCNTMQYNWLITLIKPGPQISATSILRCRSCLCLHQAQVTPVACKIFLKCMDDPVPRAVLDGNCRKGLLPKPTVR